MGSIASEEARATAYGVTPRCAVLPGPREQGDLRVMRPFRGVHPLKPCAFYSPRFSF